MDNGGRQSALFGQDPEAMSLPPEVVDGAWPLSSGVAITSDKRACSLDDVPVFDTSFCRIAFCAPAFFYFIP